MSYREKYLSPEDWELIEIHYVKGLNSIQKCARLFKVRDQRIKEHLSAKGLYRANEKRSLYIKKAADERKLKKGKYQDLK